MSADFVDPYTYPGTTVLRNRLGIRDSSKLQDVERDYAQTRAWELHMTPVAVSFDLAHLRAIHRSLFQDVYDWAGTLRTVNISKNGDSFHHAAQMQTAAEYTFSWLADSGLTNADSMTDPEFVSATAEFLSRVNYMHPFREGNGRAQRTFLNDVAAFNRRVFDWGWVSSEQNRRASAESHARGSGEPFVDLLAAIVRPRETPRARPPRPSTYAVRSAPRTVRRARPGQCGALTLHGAPCMRRGRCPHHQ